MSFIHNRDKKRFARDQRRARIRSIYKKAGRKKYQRRAGFKV